MLPRPWLSNTDGQRAQGRGPRLRGADRAGSPDRLPGAIPALVAAAHATKDLRVGTMVLNNDFRHPVLVAREAATLDLLSDGRLELGLGAGHMKSEYDQAGLSFDPGGTRVERLTEAVVIVKGLLAGEPLTFSGRHYRVTGHRIHPLPVQRPHPPIVVGGNAPRLLSLAGREADIVGLTGITFRQGGTQPDVSAWRTVTVDERIAVVRESAGERYEHLELNALVQRVVVTDDRHRAAQELATAMAEPERRGSSREPLPAHRHRGPDGRGPPRPPGALGYLLLHHVRAVPGRPGSRRQPPGRHVGRIHGEPLSSRPRRRTGRGARRSMR